MRTKRSVICFLLLNQFALSLQDSYHQTFAALQEAKLHHPLYVIHAMMAIILVLIKNVIRVKQDARFALIDLHARLVIHLNNWSQENVFHSLQTV